MPDYKAPLRDMRFALNEVLEPGEYYFVLKSGGTEVMRRHIVLLPNSKLASKTASAN